MKLCTFKRERDWSPNPSPLASLVQKTHSYKSIYSLEFIWTTKTQNQPNQNFSTLVVCSKSKLQQELDSMRFTLQQNSYPKVMIINSTISKPARFYPPVKEGLQKCSVYLKLPWIGNILLKFEKQVKSNVQICFPAVEPRAIFQTRKILPSIRKDAVPITQQSLVVYQYICCCDCRYVSRTSFRLQKRITQHIPKSFQDKRKVNKSSAKTKLQSQDSSKSMGMWFRHWTSLTSKS